MRILLLIAIIVGIGLAVTNPGPDDFERFVDDVVTQILVEEAASLPGGDVVAALGGALASRLARQYSHRGNYIFFSIYTLDMEAVGMQDQEWRFLGIGTRFIELERPEALQ